MRAEVIAIGDELTSGQRLDTNSQWLSQRLAEIGVRTMFHTTVADDLEANILAFQQAARRVDFIICTGGLDPTADDLTREAIATAFGLPLHLHQQSLDRIRDMFASRGREMPERNHVQAMFPRAASPSSIHTARHPVSTSASRMPTANAASLRAGRARGNEGNVGPWGEASPAIAFG